MPEGQFVITVFKGQFIYFCLCYTKDELSLQHLTQLCIVLPSLKQENLQIPLQHLL